MMRYSSLAIIAIIFIHHCECSNLSITLNPSCTEPQSCPRHLAYANHPLNETAYHYLIDVDDAQSIVSVLIVQTPPTDHSPNDHVNWTLLSRGDPNSVTYNHSLNAIGLTLGNLTLEQCDKDGKPFNYTTLNMKDFTPHTTLTQGNDSVGVHVNLTYNDPTLPKTAKKFAMTLNFTINNKQVRYHQSPGLLYDVGSVHVECTFSDGALPKVVNKSNILLPIHLVQFGKFDPTEQDMFDDEFSPGVFSLIKLGAVNKTSNSTVKSFLQYRPVAFYDPSHTVVSTLDVYRSDTNETIRWENSTVFGYFFGQNYVNYTKQELKLDTRLFYSKNNHTSFSFVLGLGEGTTETISPLLRYSIIVGFGVPAISLIIGVVYIFARKYFTRSSGNLIEERDSE